MFLRDRLCDCLQVKLLNHTRFVSRLLKLTRGALKVPDVVYTIIERRLSQQQLEGIDASDASAAGGGGGGSQASGSQAGGSVNGEAVLLKEKKSHSVEVLWEWISALLTHREMSGVVEKARKDLGEAEGQLKEAAEILREKASEAKRVQKRMHKINSKISGLIAATEAVPHRQALARLYEYQKLREDVVEVEQAHFELVQKLEDKKHRDQYQMEELPGSGGTPRGTGSSRRERTPKTTSRVASDAVETLERIRARHREQTEEARDHVERLDVRKSLQQDRTALTLSACTENDMPAVQELLREQTDHAAKHPDTRDQYTILECKDVEGRRPLHYCCCHGCYEVGMLLLTSGSDPQLGCDTGFTPMHYSAAYGHVQMIVLLNQFDPDLTQLVDQMGQTPLHVASQQDNPDVVSLLLKIGSDSRATDRTGTTPMTLSEGIDGHPGSASIQGVLQQSIQPIESMNPIMEETIKSLAKQFEEADAAFDELLVDIHFGDDALKEASSSESELADTSSSEEEEDEEEDAGSGKSRRSSKSSGISWDDNESGSHYTGVSQESVESQRDALAMAFGGKEAAGKMKQMLSPAQARALKEEEEREVAEIVKKERMRLENNRLGMSLFARANAEVVATRERRERMERKLARSGSSIAVDEDGMPLGVLDDERPTSTPLSAGAGSGLDGTKPEFEASKGTGKINAITGDRKAAFGASDFLQLMQGGVGEHGDADGSKTANKWMKKTRDGRPVSAAGAEGEWASIDVSTMEQNDGDFAPGSAWTKPHYNEKDSLRVQFWRELRNGSDLAKLGYGRWHRATTRPKTPPQNLTLDDITPQERVELRSVLPPASTVRAKAVKRTIKIRRKKGKQQGKNYIRGDVTSLEVEPSDKANNFFADSLSSGETKKEAGVPEAAAAGKAALKKGAGAMKMAKAFTGELPWD